MSRHHVVVHGVVQGVGFRYFMREEARRLGVSGWVRNRVDDTVEAEIEGSASAVAEMLAWLGHGPAGASVTGIDVTDAAPLTTSGFSIRM